MVLGNCQGRAEGSRKRLSAVALQSYIQGGGVPEAMQEGLARDHQ